MAVIPGRVDTVIKKKNKDLQILALDTGFILFFPTSFHLYY